MQQAKFACAFGFILVGTAASVDVKSIISTDMFDTIG